MRTMRLLPISRALIRHVQATVREVHGVELMTEVHIVGDASEGGAGEASHG